MTEPGHTVRLVKDFKAPARDFSNTMRLRQYMFSFLSFCAKSLWSFPFSRLNIHTCTHAIWIPLRSTHLCCWCLVHHHSPPGSMLIYYYLQRGRSCDFISLLFFSVQGNWFKESPNGTKITYSLHSQWNWQLLFTGSGKASKKGERLGERWCLWSIVFLVLQPTEPQLININYVLSIWC